MSTKELAYSIFETLTEKQLEGFILLFSGSNDETAEPRPKAGTLKGSLADCANPDLIPFEKEAWADAAVEKYTRNFCRAGALLPPFDKLPC
ncbi:MAG: hypothetical protein NC253_10060 [Ruminococcus sp.]|nr:hypothetical protein [Ruminococcus sp.]MCM1381022.1 hypothetical protein [Muribaculaceae bacterium]MCM1479196.1 hypothetical protein [Muribaculaceae bacterium]